MTSTLTICLSIYTNTRSGGNSRLRFKYIADILIQSSAIYSTLMLISFIFEFLRIWKLTAGVQISGTYVVNLAIAMTVSSAHNLADE